METLRTYLNGLDRFTQAAYAERCGTTLGYLRKASHGGIGWMAVSPDDLILNLGAVYGVRSFAEIFGLR